MLDVSAMRLGPLDLLAGAARAGSAVELSLLPPRARFVLRCRPGSVAAAGQAFGVTLPREACRAAVSASRAALWLGPDEWLLLAAAEDAAAIMHQLSVALAAAPHALVGMCTRTLFEKAEIVLWRMEEHTYHVEIERSYAPYVWLMLIEAREDLA
jgi:sarcosine oxidase, subunit gamma